MIRIPDVIKDLFITDNVKKNFRVIFPNGEYPDMVNNKIEQESVTLTESISSQSVIQFGLCESPMIEFVCHGMPNFTRKTIKCQLEVDISSLSAEDIAQYGVTSPDVPYPYYVIPYGTYIVKECKKSGDSDKRKVVGYSKLSYLEWNNTLKDILSPLKYVNWYQSFSYNLRTSTLLSLFIETDSDDYTQIGLQPQQSAYTTNYDVDTLFSQFWNYKDSTGTVGLKDRYDIIKSNAIDFYADLDADDHIIHFSGNNPIIGNSTSFLNKCTWTKNYNVYSEYPANENINKNLVRTTKIKFNINDFLTKFNNVKEYFVNNSDGLIKDLRLYMYICDDISEKNYSDISLDDAAINGIPVYNKITSYKNSIINANNGSTTTPYDNDDSSKYMKWIIGKEDKTIITPVIEKQSITTSSSQTTTRSTNGLSNYTVNDVMGNVYPSEIYTPDVISLPKRMSFQMLNDVYVGQGTTTEYTYNYDVGDTEITNINHGNSKVTYISSPVLIKGYKKEIQTEAEVFYFDTPRKVFCLYPYPDTTIISLILNDPASESGEINVSVYSSYYRGSALSVEQQIELDTEIKYHDDEEDDSIIIMTLSTGNNLVNTKTKTQSWTYNEQTGYSYTYSHSTRNDYSLYNALNTLDFSKFETKEIIQSALEIQGKFGMIDRTTGNIKIIDLTDHLSLYPSPDLYPAQDLYPRGYELLITRNMYKLVEYEDSATRHYDRISCTWTDSSNNEHYQYYDIVDHDAPDYDPDDYQTYSLSENYFIKNKYYTVAQVTEILHTLGDKIKGFQYFPCDVECVGLPYVETGDGISVITKDSGFTSFVLRRTIKGIQSLEDNIEAR